MLNSNRVLKYVKTYFGFPHTHVELEDTEILDYIKEFTLREFSHYVPEKKKMGLNLTLASNKVTNIENEFYLTEPDGLEILNVVDLILPMGNLLLFGHPPYGAFGQPTDLRSWALATETANMVKHFSSYNYSFDFLHPNILQITPSPSDDYCIVEYERVQPDDFSGIANDMQMLFLKFASYDIGIYIGRIRNKFSDLRTPFGEINIQKEIIDESKEGKKELIEKLSVSSLPNVIMDRG